MLTAEAARLAAIECLSPTAANEGTVAFPTLAGGRIFDSRATAVQDIDEARPFTPAVSVYSREGRSDLRGEGAAFDDTDASFTLEIVAELAVIAREEGEDYADAMAGSDPDARLVLVALLAQVRRLLTYSEGGRLFRRFVKAIDRTEFEPYAVPELGLRWQRITMRLTCRGPDDCFSDAAGLPEPIRTLAALLPANSYAAAKLVQLEASFAQIARTPLGEIVLTASDDPEAEATALFEIPQG